ncbi:MAG TPA: ATP-binding protein [Clostridia bacterium]|jgi:MinD superfamily P-loop ATPase|nr:ATP-binding protein [Clostridia bacterium]
MKIAVLSGKGGTGKTLVSVNLATVAKSSTYIDCDVEEPNGHLFFKPTILAEKDVSVKIPKLNPKLCTGCRRCVDFCKFNALAIINNKPIIFDEVCHSCGGCVLVCPEKAFSEIDKSIGKVQMGKSGNVDIYTGILNIGEATGIPIISNLLSNKQDTLDKPVIIDCPPGSSCIVMESIKDADYCVLVAEPTLFGVHNLNMVYELVTLFKKPFGVVLNKCLDGDNPAELFCIEKNIKILAHIPFDPELGKLNSEANIVVKHSDKYHNLFSSLLEKIITEVANEATTNS